MYIPRIAILISGTGSNMEVILKACITGELPAQVSFVGSDNINAKGLSTAAALGAPTRVFFYKRDGREAAEEAIAKAVEETHTDWIILAGFMKILSPGFVRRFPTGSSTSIPRCCPLSRGTRHPRRMGGQGRPYRHNSPPGR